MTPANFGINKPFRNRSFQQNYTCWGLGQRSPSTECAPKRLAKTN